MDKIIIKNMRLYGYHGVLEEEKRIGQKFFVDLEIYLDLEKASMSDNLNDTVNYAKIYEKVEFINRNQKYDLIEKFAGDIAKEILKYDKVKNVRVTVKKPEVPIPGQLDYVAVEIYR
ncbi:dihydroneopterin aldolase [Haliovirga abyssi]|uniref:7,8-dihydroneopterin aldolase n=1 Tax=Haliovirga abyssi TaxID=2996794 RepID=A0AAU9DLX6_9FUSO|nr:dihydroneopterin aldolase [Haliovirga abyssi]BDU50982.1 7,8-dihydroneopterin aldolase [Haliovirga abyssi]